MRNKSVSTLFRCLARLAVLIALVIGNGAFAHDTQKKKPEIKCPSTDFSVFLKAFADAEHVQRAFTADPLRKQQLDPDAEPEPKPGTRWLKRQEVSFPVIPPSLERARDSLELRVVEVSGDKAKVMLEKPNTDYQVSYFFDRKDCWRLVGIEDWSL